MKWRSSLIYFLVLVLLGGYYYYFEVVARERNEAAERQAKRVFDIKVENIKALEIESTDKNSVHLVKNGVWKITSPIQCEVDQTTFDGLLSTLATLEMERVVIADANDLQPYGLVTPALKIRIQQSDQAAELVLGDTNPSGDAYYAKVGEINDVFLVSRGVWGILNKGLNELRRQELFSFESQTVKGLSVVWEDGRLIEVARHPEKDWQAADQTGLKIKGAKVENVLDQLRWLRAAKFIENDLSNLAKYGLAQPQVTIQVKLPDNRSVELLLGRESEEGKQIPAVSSEIPAIVLVSTDILQDLPASIQALQDRSILTHKADEVTDIEWRLGTERGHLVRMDATRWGFFQGSGEQPLELKDSWQASSLLYDLAQAEYLQEKEPVTTPPAEPFGRLRLCNGQQELLSIAWQQTAENPSKPVAVWVQSGGQSPTTVAVEGELLQRIESDLDRFRPSDGQ